MTATGNNEVADSIRHHEERIAKMRVEAEASAQKDAQAAEQRRQHQLEREQTARLAQANELEVQAGRMQEIESRDQLLDHIRKMRETPPPVDTSHINYRSPEQQEQYDLEVMAGREASAKAAADLQRRADLQMLATAADLARQGDTVPVHHPNPSQEEIFPTVKATLPGSKSGSKK